MALSKDKKNQIVAEVSDLLSKSKLTVVAQYQGTTVKAMQSLRRDAKNNGTKISVIKNRLVVKAVQNNDKFKSLDTSSLSGQLLYAFNSVDEVAPAQVLNNFAKSNPSIEFVGAITSDGKFMSAEEVKTLAVLPSKDELIAQTVSTLLSPVNDITNALSGNIHALLDGVETKATS